MRRNVGFFKLSLCVLPMLGAAALTAAQDRRQESPPNLAVMPVPE